MLQRRIFLSGLACAGVGLGSSVRAQRPAHPIARPPRLRPDGSILAGRFGAGDGVASGALPGLFVVVAVNAKDDTLQLRDEGGRTDTVHVNGDMFDLESLKPGDEVEVDFVLPQPGGAKFEAGNIWKVQR
jgi:hypothetical protein